MKKTITSLAFEAGLSPFNAITVLNGEPDVIGEQVSKALLNRNRYFDKENRERFGTQVHRIETSPNRLALGAVESALPKGTRLRRYRAVVFRCDGNVIYQTPDGRNLDYRSACIDMRYWLTHSDESKMLADLCRAQIRAAANEYSKAESVLSAIAVGAQSP